MRVLALDPGLERMGYAVLDGDGTKFAPIAYGLIETPRVAIPERLRMIRAALESIIGRDRPDHLATERLFFTKNTTTALDVSKALGVALATAAEHGLGWSEYTPPQVKLAVTGHGRADKTQVGFMVARLLGLTEVPRPDDVADALAIGLAHGMSSRVLTA